ncbi:hypothetical protein FF011L_46360 [Roseimaritima multifibrata]|uniref:Conserved hypothetical protein CHP03032 domain-containing protein n=1 Tax=Roseimaritima multifibrata TaxID=1930274 RepID=A0A517MLQ4_9BACT|nr:TIGR03032 family protein [Roseimaritima multifibrata]QDS95835.1 hypothetical protein FF011L_46360 [Roseimaritima multifibrata]
MTELKPTREVRFEFTNELPGLLNDLGISLLATTYQAGKLVAIGTQRGQLEMQMCSVARPMGLAVSAGCLAIGAQEAVWFADACPEMARQIEPAGRFDAGYSVQRASMTGDIAIHDMAWGNDDQLWAVNTRFSCLCLCDDQHHFSPVWKPPFISNLAAEDRCHLNGLAMQNGKPRYVTVMSQTDTAEGWRPSKATSGCILSVPDGRCLVSGLSMPHSPRVFQNRLFALNSGLGAIGWYEKGQFQTLSKQPGFTRGLDFYGHYAFVGLSKIRETSTFGGIPIADDRDSLKCAIVVVDLRTGKRVAHFEFLAGVDELFDVRVLPKMLNPYIGGPHPHVDNGPVAWLAKPFPSPRQAAEMLSPVVSIGGVPVQELEITHDRITPELLQQFNRATSLAEAQDYEQAISLLQRCAHEHPTVAAVHCNLGVALQLAGRVQDAYQPLQTAFDLAPQNPAVQFNLSMAELQLGHYQNGWRHYEARWSSGQGGALPKGLESWGVPASDAIAEGSTLLVYGEQGIGDEIMFFSLLKRLQATMPSVQLVVACDPRLVGLLRRSYPTLTVISSQNLSALEYRRLAASVTCRIPCGSLPGMLRFPDEVSDHDRQERTLSVDPLRVEYWRQELRRRAGKEVNEFVGVSWAGGKNVQEHAVRSIPLPAWGEIFEPSPNAQFVNLQYGVSRTVSEDSQPEQVGQAFLANMITADQIAPLVDLEEFAAMISALDRVVSIDNSTLHLAGALGIPTVGILPVASSAAYRWGTKTEATIWYPSVRLVRRKLGESDSEVICRAAKALE